MFLFHMEPSLHGYFCLPTNTAEDMDTYLPGDILCKVDRASMKYSLEARCPILDKDVMEYSFRIPHGFKFHKGDKKHILKDIAYDYIPS